jgi:hypothetical protein
MMVRPRNRKRYPIQAATVALMLGTMPALAQQPAPPPAPPPGQQATTLPATPPAPATAEDCGCGVPSSPRGPR